MPHDSNNRRSRYKRFCSFITIKNGLEITTEKIFNIHFCKFSFYSYFKLCSNKHRSIEVYICLRSDQYFI